MLASRLASGCWLTKPSFLSGILGEKGGRSELLPPKHFISPQQKTRLAPACLAGVETRILWGWQSSCWTEWLGLFGTKKHPQLCEKCGFVWSWYLFMSVPNLIFHLKTFFWQNMLQNMFLRFLLLFLDGGFQVSCDLSKEEQHRTQTLGRFLFSQAISQWTRL